MQDLIFYLEGYAAAYIAIRLFYFKDTWCRKDTRMALFTSLLSWYIFLVIPIFILMIIGYGIYYLFQMIPYVKDRHC